LLWKSRQRISQAHLQLQGAARSRPAPWHRPPRQTAASGRFHINNYGGFMQCHCFIVPKDVLERFAKDKSLSAAERQNFANMAEFEAHWRKVRSAASVANALALSSLSGATPTAAGVLPSVTVYNCATSTHLPGTFVPTPGTSADATAKRAFVETTAVAEFYRKIFGRNSVDNQGMALQSSIHYGVKYNNAFWNGTQMTYGDGDGNIFVDFTKGNDVIGHELTHGVTQFSAQFAYANEPGGLNESASDVFGSMFRQWQKKQTVTAADWLIGNDIMGKGAIAKGYTCLRDMANPAAAHCLSPQPTQYSQYQPGMDPHYSSGIPNFAFYKAAMALGGHSWDVAGQIWYKALTGFAPSPNMKMKVFANRTRKLAKSLYPTQPAVYAAVHQAWLAVGL
jgi:Zn-dependent metalloprotease